MFTMSHFPETKQTRGVAKGELSTLVPFRTHFKLHPLLFVRPASMRPANLNCGVCFVSNGRLLVNIFAASTNVSSIVFGLGLRSFPSWSSGSSPQCQAQNRARSWAHDDSWKMVAAGIIHQLFVSNLPRLPKYFFPIVLGQIPLVASYMG